MNFDSLLLRKLVSGEDLRLELDVGGTVLPVAYQPMLVSKVVKAALKQSPLLLTTSWEGHWRDRRKNVLLFVPWVDRLIEPEKRKTPPALPTFPVGTPIVLRRG